MYPNLNDPKFYKKLLRKKEFYDNQANFTVNEKLSLEPQQIVLSNYITPHTPYDSLLIFHDTGVGKTGAAVAIADKFIDHVKKSGNKSLILVKNSVIEDNFKNEIREPFTFTYEEIIKNFSDDDFKQELANLTNKKKSTKTIFKNVNGEHLQVKIKEDLSKSIEIITHDRFVNRTIGRPKHKFDEKKSKDDKREISGQQIFNISNRLVIVDEAHNLIGNDGYIALKKMLSISTNVKLVLMTATPIFDNVSELPQLLNLLLPDNVSILNPKSSKTLKDIFNYKQVIDKTPINIPGKINIPLEIPFVKDDYIPVLRQLLKGKVSYLRVNPSTFPKKIDKGESLNNRPGSLKVVKSEMSHFQWKGVMAGILSDSKDKGSVAFNNSSNASTFVSPISDANDIPLYGSKGFKSMFDTEKTKDPRFKEIQSNLVGDLLKKFSIKCFEIIKNIKKAKGPVFVYSDRKTEGGVSVIYKLLLLNGFSENTIALISSDTPIQKRRKLLDIFNSYENRYGDKIKILLGTRSISEGITLKSVRQVHILEPAWNYSRLKQVIGRAIRNRSHEFLPPVDRDVEVYMYIATPPKDIPIKSIDELKYNVIEEKSRSIAIVQRIMKEMAFDCALNKERNILNSKFDHSEKCDYTVCDYLCDSKNLEDLVKKESKIDYSTYFESVSSSKIKLAQKQIKELFNHSSYWTFNQMIEKLEISREIIAIALQSLLENNSEFKDIFDRKGHLRYLGYYYIFQPNDLSFDASSFDRLKPSNLPSKGSLSTFLDQLEKIIANKKLSVQNSPKEPIKMDIPPPIQTPRKIKKKKEMPKEIKKLDLDSDINQKIIQHEIYGSYLNRSGILDKKFRIIDNALNKSSKDTRKIQTGVACGTGIYNKNRLTDIIERLGINIGTEAAKMNKTVNRLSNTELCKMIEDNLKSRNLIIQ